MEDEEEEVVFVKRQKMAPEKRPSMPPPLSSQPPLPYQQHSHLSPALALTPQLHFECFICGTALHSFDDCAKDEHLNHCLDKLEPGLGNSRTDGIRAENYGCLLCGLSLNSKPLITRCQHLKRCSKIYGIGIRELLQMIAPEKFEEVWTQLDQSMSQQSVSKPAEEAKRPNANEILMANARVKWNSSSVGGPSPPTPAHGPAINRQEPKRRRAELAQRGPGNDVDYAPEYKKVMVAPMTTPVIVDGFSFASATLSDCYFLTHFHSDHYSGLTRAFEYGPLALPSSLRH
jgi:hypothetical protein